MLYLSEAMAREPHCSQLFGFACYHSHQGQCQSFSVFVFLRSRK